MKMRIARCFIAAAGVACIAGTPALFAGDRDRDRDDLRRDYNHVAREDRDIRADRHRLRHDLEHGRYWDAARTRRDLERDYVERDRQLRDISRDRRDLRRDEFRRNDYWR